jgi:ankyrin repeat protein
MAAPSGPALKLLHALKSCVKDVQSIIDECSVADLNTQFDTGSTLLGNAATYNPGAIKALVRAGADVNARDGRGLTPIMFAIKTNADSIGALIDSGADVDAKDGLGRKPIAIAARFSAWAIKILVDAGADVNGVADRHGRRPLAIAARFNADSIKALVDAGADLTAPGDEAGRSVLTYVKSNQAAMRRLAEAGVHDAVDAIQAQAYSEMHESVIMTPWPVIGTGGSVWVRVAGVGDSAEYK